MQTRRNYRKRIKDRDSWLKREETVTNQFTKNCKICQMKTNFTKENFAIFGFLSTFAVIKKVSVNIFQFFWTKFKGSEILFRE